MFQDLELDCSIELTQAPGLSAYNRAERKMYHLSKELSGVILPAETYGTHLRNGATVDEELEERNFQAAGETLAEIWDGLVIDGKAVKSEYVLEAPNEEIKNFEVSFQYKSCHIIQTQYITAVLKCDCCSPCKTPIQRFFPDRRVPPLIPIRFTINGPEALELEPNVHQKQLNFLDVFQRLSMEKEWVPNSLKEKYGENVPYNVYFPTQQDKVDGRVCKICGKYFSVKITLTEHKRICKRPQNVLKRRKALKSVKKVIESSSESGDSEDAREDSEDKEESETEIEMVELRPLIKYWGH